MKRALVLGGGGSKGAYEIGVWRALNELNQKFDIVCGTSIGALIGVLYVQHDYQKAYDLWDQITVDDVMVNGVNMDMDIEMIMSQKGKYVEFLSSYMHNKGADISPFINMIDRMFDSEKFFDSEIDYGCMTVNFSKLLPQPMLKKDLDASNVKDYILASASCFPAFPMKEINEERFIDGGYHDNVPITLARDMGAEEIVAVDLKSVGKNQVKPPQSDTVYIAPYVPLGSFLLFDSEKIHRNMELGYLDAMKKFNKYLGYIYTFPLTNKDIILTFEDNMEKALNHIDDVLNRNKMNKVVEKVVNYQITECLKPYKDYEYPYLAIIEQIAYTFEIDNLAITNLHVLMQQIFNIADTHVSLLEDIKGKKGKTREMLDNLKEQSKIDIICYIYHYLLKLDGNPSKEIETMSVVANDSFMQAYALYSIKKEFKLYIKE
ncbi:MAG: patatin-like phospholipase family protein [Longicatena sp.]